jgi:formate dehydrogenase subunit delta
VSEGNGSGSLRTLRRMANQIAVNFQALGHDEAVLATADHIDMFWDPRMKAGIFADDRSQLSPTAAAAIDYLATGKHPPHQTRATEFNTVDEVGHSDAG